MNWKLSEPVKSILAIIVAVGIIALVTWLTSLGLPTGAGVRP
jgi:hypothetical protein